MMKLTAIVAMTPDRIIGKGNDLPWHLPEDLKLFKKTTSGHPILMGRKTWDSIGFPLPKRQSIVLTRDTSWSAEGAHTIHSPEQLKTLDLIDTHVYIIGGAEIYKLFLPLLDELIVSYVYERYEGDTQFPEFHHHFSQHSVLEKYEDFELRKYTKV